MTSSASARVPIDPLRACSAAPCIGQRASQVDFSIAGAGASRPMTSTVGQVPLLGG
jgi:hypothetical protein